MLADRAVHLPISYITRHKCGRTCECAVVQRQWEPAILHTSIADVDGRAGAQSHALDSRAFDRNLGADAHVLDRARTGDGPLHLRRSICAARGHTRALAEPVFKCVRASRHDARLLQRLPRRAVLISNTRPTHIMSGVRVCVVCFCVRVLFASREVCERTRCAQKVVCLNSANHSWFNSAAQQHDVVCAHAD